MNRRTLLQNGLSFATMSLVGTAPIWEKSGLTPECIVPHVGPAQAQLHGRLWGCGRSHPQSRCPCSEKHSFHGCLLRKPCMYTVARFTDDGPVQPSSRGAGQHAGHTLTSIRLLLTTSIAAGYSTALIGKMHWVDGQTHGFDYRLEFNDWFQSSRPHRPRSMPG